jgi:hypothetical protein
MAGGRGCASTGEGKKGKGRAERGCDRLDRRPCRGRCRGLSPARGCTHACVRAAVVWRRGQEIEIGWEKEEREIKTCRVHRSARQGEVARFWDDLGCSVGKVGRPDGVSGLGWLGCFSFRTDESRVSCRLRLESYHPR